VKIANPKFCILILIILTLIECSLTGYIGWWREGFWSAVQSRNLDKFFIYIGMFSIAALTTCFVSSYSQYIISYTSLIYRHKLSRKALKIVHKVDVEGKEQRVQEDCFNFPFYLISLIVGFTKNFIILLVFLGILIHQLGLFYLIFPITYAIIGTWIAAKLAKPLLNINYLNQMLEAKFRRMLTKISYSKVHKNNLVLFKATKKLAYFQYFYNQITVIIPYLVLYPIYFSAKITFGVFMQCASSMNQIIECLSYFINSFNDINKFRSCKKRLNELGII
jgi:putative ATP-binding cassette transporter